MQKILQAGRWLRHQPQKIYILRKKMRWKIRFLTKYAYNAPVVLLVCADERKAWHSRQTSNVMDASVIVPMMLEAWELGIGSRSVRRFPCG